MPAQITTKSEAPATSCTTTQTFTELSLARRVWASMIEGAQVRAAAKNLASLNERVNEKNANVWYDVLNENADPSSSSSATTRSPKAGGRRRWVCDKTAKLYCEIRTELLIHLHEASVALLDSRGILVSVVIRG